MRIFLILPLLLCGAAGQLPAEPTTNTPEIADNTTTSTEATTTTEKPDPCICQDIVYEADEMKGSVKIEARPDDCKPVQCHFKIVPAEGTILTMVSYAYHYENLIDTVVYYYNSDHVNEDEIVYKRKEWNGISYHAPENYGFHIAVFNNPTQILVLYEFRRYDKEELTRFCPEPHIKVNATPQSLQTKDWGRSGCAFRFESDYHPIRLLATCKNINLKMKANTIHSHDVYEEVNVIGNGSVTEMILQSISDVSIMPSEHYYNWLTETIDCEIKYVAINYDPCNCSTTNFNLTIDKPQLLSSPGYPNMMCGNIKCQYNFTVSQPAPNGMRHAFVVRAVHKTRARGDYLLFKVDDDEVDNLNEHQKNISETAIYIGDRLSVEYSASSQFSSDHGFDLALKVIEMPDDCECPTHKSKELPRNGSFNFTVQSHCPMMYCRFEIPNDQLETERVFRLQTWYNLPHDGETIDVEAGEVEEHLYGMESLDKKSALQVMDFVTNSTVKINYVRDAISGNLMANGISNFGLQWEWITKSECDCHSSGTLAAEINKPGILYSPRFPENYCSGTHCEYHIQAPEDCHIRFNVSSFETEPHMDFIYFYDGQNNTVLGRLSGHLRKQTIFETKSRNATVLFTSDQNNNAKGFKIQYQAVKNHPVPLEEESSPVVIAVVVVLVLLLLTTTIFFLYKKFFKKSLVLQTVENPVFSFSADQDVVVVLDKE